MNWEAIGATGELIGAFAVVVSLIYVGVPGTSIPDVNASRLIGHAEQLFTLARGDVGRRVSGSHNHSTRSSQRPPRYGSLLEAKKGLFPHRIRKIY